MTKRNDKATTRAALAELERLSLLLDTELEVTANMPIEEVEEGLRAMGLDPQQPPPAKLGRMLAKKARGAAAGASGAKVLNHVYVSDEPLRGECENDEVRLLILKIRHLGRQHRYEEAFELAQKAVRLAPDYWRARLSLGTLLVVFGRVDEGDEIFARVVTDFADNPKAVAAGLHNRAWVDEIKGQPEFSRRYEEALRLDDSRANTRACLLVHTLTPEAPEQNRQIVEESALHEGFFEALHFELTERGERAHKALKALPTWLTNLLYPAGPTRAGLAAHYEG